MKDQEIIRWVRFDDEKGRTRVGVVEGEDIVVHTGDIFGGAEATDERLPLRSVTLLAPCQPTKIIGLWNNLGSAAEKFGWSTPSDPLYFIKPSSSLIGHESSVRRPASYTGRIVYEGELGVVIGQRCVDVAMDDVDDVVFGYTCVNDVTAMDLITEDESFAQWARAKGFDTFAALGPVIATGIEPDALHVTTLVGGKARQDYDVSDMNFSPRQLVHLISRDLTLMPGDVIACGTSVGVMPMRPGVPIEICIEGIGTLRNTLAASD